MELWRRVEKMKKSYGGEEMRVEVRAIEQRVEMEQREQFQTCSTRESLLNMLQSTLNCQNILKEKKF